ncbi:MAG TPA: polya polymerase [Desulfobulbaceae bacterium]|nr:polya polymerase [Desulfobulbaceae bacterium]
MNIPIGPDSEQPPERSSTAVDPVIIQEHDHPIRLHDLDKEALKVLYRLRDAGHSGYLVGGGVRDLYLGKQPKDFDISTDARPGQLRKLFRNSRTIGRRFRLVQVYFRGGKIIEVSTLRSQSEYDIDRPDDEIEVLPANNTFGTLAEDAKRRDLTINSLFYEIENRTIIDYVGGVRDLDQGIIRIAGDPDRRVTRDPVRIMRTVRHAARTGFCIEPATWKAIVANREKIRLCPPSRIRDELFKDLHSGSSEPWARIALDSSLFFTLFPWYAEIPMEEDSPHRRMLLSLLAVVDRLLKRQVHDYRIEIPDYMLLTLLVMPWVNARFDLLRQRLKGSAHYQFSREIRRTLDELFGEHFNLKRGAKDSMTTLLVNLPSFEQFSRHSSWPNWLQKKSYFRDGLRFFSLYRETMEGAPADEQQFAVAVAAAGHDFFPPPETGAVENGSTGRKGFRPAFTRRKRGVFGLRNK